MSPKSLFPIFLLISFIFLSIGVMASKRKPKEHQIVDSGEPEIFLRRQRDLAKSEPKEGENEEPMVECTIRVKKVESVKGKCVKLKGGFGGCQTERFLDPTNEDCEEE